MVFTLSIAAAAAEPSHAEVYTDKAISDPEMGLFSSITDAMDFHEKILNARYYLFEPGSMVKADSPPSSVIFPDRGKTRHDFQWLFNRFNRKSKGLIILPVLNSGVHISYKLDF